MVRQHDPRRPDANAIGRLPDMREHDRGRGARDPRHAVMLGNPVAFIAERLGMAGEIGGVGEGLRDRAKSEEHTSELQSLMRISYAVFCLKKKKQQTTASELYRRSQQANT